MKKLNQSAAKIKIAELKKINAARARSGSEPLQAGSVVEIHERSAKAVGKWGGYVHIAVVAMPLGHEMMVIRDTVNQEVIYDSGRVSSRSSGKPGTDYYYASERAKEVFSKLTKRAPAVKK